VTDWVDAVKEEEDQRILLGYGKLGWKEFKDYSSDKK